VSGTIRQVRTRADLDLWQEVWVAAYDADFVGLPADPIEEQLRKLDGVTADTLHELWVGLDEAGRPVSAADLMLPLRDHPITLEVDLVVAPHARRHGHGRRLADHALERTRAHNRSRVHFHVVHRPAEDTPGERLGRALGGRNTIVNVRRMLDLTEVSEESVQRLRAEAEACADGYDVVQWVERAPDELVDSLAELEARMSTDPPQGEMDFEPEVWDAERWRLHEEDAIQRNRVRFGTAAVDRRTGRAVGFSDIGVNRDRVEVAYQWDTIVDPVHRGHRLGLLMKAANLQWIRGQVPGIRFINTWNADENTYMVSINERLGFRIMEYWATWQLDLPVVVAP
jgi:GNAT superfamily N-acetyltransferase